MSHLWNRYFSGEPGHVIARTQPQPGILKPPVHPPQTVVGPSCYSTMGNKSVRFSEHPRQHHSQPDLVSSVFPIIAAPPRPNPYYPPPSYNSSSNLVSSQSSLATSDKYSMAHPISSLSSVNFHEIMDNEVEAQKIAHTLECLKPTALGLSISSIITGLPGLSCLALYLAMKSPTKDGKRKHYCLSIVLSILAILLAICLVLTIVLLWHLPRQLRDVAGFGHNIRYSDGIYTCWCKNEFLKDCECSKRIGNGHFKNWDDCHCTTNRVCDCMGWEKSVSFFV